MRFLHTADVHLDSPMRGLARYEGAPVEQLRGATRRAFERLVQTAVDEQVEFVVIAGDLYDGDRDDYQTAMFLQRQLHILCESGIPVVIAYGNHDAANEITKRLSLPDGVHLFPHDSATSIELESADAMLHGRSYATRAVFEDLSASYPAPVEGLLNIGVLHTSIDGRPGHDPYAPCTLDRLVHQGYDYWALGHVHRRESDEREGVHVVFPGNLQGRDVGELGPKGATLVDYNSSGIVAVAHRDLAVVRWSLLEPDLSMAGSTEDVLARVLADLEALQAASETELDAVRVVLNVPLGVSQHWMRDAEQLESQLRADAAGDRESLWIERIDLVPSNDAAEEVPGEAVAAIRDALVSLRGGSASGERSRLSGMLTGLRTRFGPDFKEAVERGAEVLDEDRLDTLFDEVEALLTAELEDGTS